MKKFISIFLLCSFILLLFTSCMSSDEKQQARENEKTARPMLEKYVEENYQGAVVGEVECLTNTSYDLFAATYATEYVKATVLYNRKTFNVLVNLETGEFYNGFYLQKISDEMESLVFDEIEVEKPKDIEIRFMLNDFEDIVENAWDCFEEDIDSAEELLKTGRYKMFMVCKYANSQIDFKEIPIKSFFKSEYTGDIQIAFVNYRDKMRYDNSDVLDITSIDSLSSLFNGNSSFVYNASDLRLASRINETYWQDGENKTSFPYEEEYRHYKSEIYNNIEFIWNSESYDIDFSDAIAEGAVSTELYSDALFYPISEKAVKLRCTAVLSSMAYDDNEVYMYFPKDLYGAYLVVQSDGEAEAKKLSLNRNEYTYEYQELSGLSQEFTIGLYKIVNTKQKQ